MEIEIKKAVKAGNSSAVILPRAWLNQEVRVELVKKTFETMLLDTINIAKKYIDLKEVIGIYLAGSYARGEETKESDIDILIITRDTDKEMINEGIYNLLMVSKEVLKQKLENNLFPVGQMIKEAKPLTNSDYLDSIKIEVTKKNVRWYVDTTKEKLDIIKGYLDNNAINNKVVYTLILRIRTLYIIKNLVNNKTYSNKKFIELIRNISGSNNAYSSYLAEKDKREEKNKTGKEEAEKLYSYLKRQLDEIKRLLKYK